MVKQRLEGLFRTSCNQLDISFYVMKLQVMPLAHLRPPADFQLLTDKHNYLIECKQIKHVNKTSSFSFNRLTQLQDMLEWEDTLKRNKSYLLLMFYTGRLKTSDIYLIPINIFYKYINMSRKKSINNFDLNKHFFDYKINVKNNLLFLEGKFE